MYVPAHHHAPNTRARIEAIAEATKDENPTNVACEGQHQIPVCFNAEFNVQARPLIWPNRPTLQFKFAATISGERPPSYPPPQHRPS
jgi:hypothetical protein